jgi:hypothetical protein
MRTHLAAQVRAFSIHGRHANERYRIVPRNVNRRCAIEAAEHSEVVHTRARSLHRRIEMRAAGSVSSATWTSRCTRPVSATTAPARASSAPGAISPRRRRSRAVRRLRRAQCAELLERGSRRLDPRDRRRQRRAGRGRARMRLERCQSSLPERYRILEISADLRARQRELARGASRSCSSRVEWLDTPPAEPFDGVILANEVLDALPVRDFAGARRAARSWCRRASGAMLASGRAPASAPLDAPARSLPRPRMPGTAATRLRVLPATARLDRGGHALTARARCYGSIMDCRARTIICRAPRRHLAVPFPAARARPIPSICPGLQDITAWVDFTALAQAGAAAGFELAGYTTQTYFLAGTGHRPRNAGTCRRATGRFARLSPIRRETDDARARWASASRRWHGSARSRGDPCGFGCATCGTHADLGRACGQRAFALRGASASAAIARQARGPMQALRDLAPSRVAMSSGDGLIARRRVARGAECRRAADKDAPRSRCGRENPPRRRAAPGEALRTAERVGALEKFENRRRACNSNARCTMP